CDQVASAIATKTSINRALAYWRLTVRNSQKDIQQLDERAIEQAIKWVLKWVLKWAIKSAIE
ncbi:hypothetical protein OAS73_04750, partial [Luminiphilus sp.]|nr:hypothetical protein [Luminiphilus sp.]